VLDSLLHYNTMSILFIQHPAISFVLSLSSVILLNCLCTLCKW